MDSNFRGGNSRLLARMLDRDTGPMAVLDAKGQIVFVNAALCTAAKLDSSVLVGKKCSWEVPQDHSVAPALLSALAPPDTVRSGRLAIRHLTTPPIYGTHISGELFIPVVDDAANVQLVLVLLGSWDQIRTMAAGTETTHAAALGKRDDESVLANIRAKWPALDGLHALVGDSPAIHTAMRRAMVAAESSCDVIIFGPRGVGKTEVARGLFMSRLRRMKLSKAEGVFFAIDCIIVSEDQIENMLDAYEGRINHDRRKGSQNLVISNANRLSPATIKKVSDRHQKLSSQTTLTITCTDMDATRELNESLQAMAQIEIVVPSLSARREDIGPLLRKELAGHFAALDQPPTKIGARATQLLNAYLWPGNLLELREAARSIVENLQLRLGEFNQGGAPAKELIETSDLPIAIRTFPGSVQTQATEQNAQPIDLDEVLLGVEKEMISRALALSPRNRAAAARMLGISRPRLLRRIEQLGLGDC